MGCISPLALLSGLALRVEREGYVPTTADLRALLGLGLSKEEVRAAFVARAATRTDETFARAIAVLEEIPPAP
ncbi:MAG: hypothetical protein QM820_63885 [Minicystis sp.]